MANNNITIYKYPEDKEYIQDQLGIIIHNDQHLIELENFTFRGAYKQDIKGNFVMQKLVNAYDRNCVLPAVKLFKEYSGGESIIKVKPSERRIIARALIDEYYTDYYKTENRCKSIIKNK